MVRKATVTSRSHQGDSISRFGSPQKISSFCAEFNIMHKSSAIRARISTVVLVVQASLRPAAYVCRLVGCWITHHNQSGPRRGNSHPVPRDRQPYHMWGTETPTQTPSRESNPGRRRRSPNACLCAPRIRVHTCAFFLRCVMFCNYASRYIYCIFGALFILNCLLIA